MPSIASFCFIALPNAKGNSAVYKQPKESLMATTLSDFDNELQNLATNTGAKVLVKNASVNISRGSYTPGVPGSPSLLEGALEASVTGTAVFKNETIITISGDLTETKKVNGKTESQQEPLTFRTIGGFPGQQEVGESFSVEQPLTVVNGVVQPINPGGNFAGNSTSSAIESSANPADADIEVDALATSKISEIFASGDLRRQILPE